VGPKIHSASGEDHIPELDGLLEADALPAVFHHLAQQFPRVRAEHLETNSFKQGFFAGASGALMKKYFEAPIRSYRVRFQQRVRGCSRGHARNLASGSQ
jgi:hypothetical protein